MIEFNAENSDTVPLRNIVAKGETTMSNLMLDVDQAGELKAAFRRANWTNELIKQLCESDLLVGLKQVIGGVAEIVMKSPLSVFKSVTIAATEQKLTADCFTDSARYYYRDPNLDNWLPEVQEAQTEGKVTVHQLTVGAKFVEMVQSLLATKEDDIVALSRLAVEAGHVFTLAQIETLIERQGQGEDVGLRTDGWANFFLVLNAEGSVSVVYVRRIARRWGVCVDPLADSDVWNAGNRFFARN